jgi:putative phosphoribosyl transferase
MPLYKDRIDAGALLAKALLEYANREDVIVLGLPRGGVPVAYQVAEALQVTMDVWIVRKIGVPGQEELAMGAVASGGIRILNEDIVDQLGIPATAVAAAAAQEQVELERRELLYRGVQTDVDLKNRTAIVVDDGMATGMSMRAAVISLRTRKPGEIVAAVPVAASSPCELLRRDADRVVCLHTPGPFRAVGQWYEDFSQTTDDEVRFYIDKASRIGKPVQR